ncbi:hypothetical protein CRG98_024798 [Punica granatum]|uniref:Uncharacterized protein n=1 Tax=Punica granatum TaxID=22663 RepID=A0A2I0JEY1_PUNGR|nr:hypothetical protein CRG98_024798 [Punica granatum]
MEEERSESWPMSTRVIPPNPRTYAHDHWLLSIWICRGQRMTFRDPRLGIFDCHHPDEEFRAPVHIDLCDHFSLVPLNKRLEFIEHITMLALCTAEHDHEGRGGFTVEANLDHVITNVVPDGILRLLGHARDGGGGVADPEALYIGPICLDDMTNNFWS